MFGSSTLHPALYISEHVPRIEVILPFLPPAGGKKVSTNSDKSTMNCSKVDLQKRSDGNVYYNTANKIVALNCAANHARQPVPAALSNFGGSLTHILFENCFVDALHHEIVKLSFSTNTKDFLQAKGHIR